MVILNKPEIAEKLRQEMDSVIGRSHSPKLADRSRLTYAEAVVLELLRWTSPAPILVPRRAEEDIEFRGYTIPKDATVKLFVFHLNISKISSILISPLLLYFYISKMPLLGNFRKYTAQQKSFKIDVQSMSTAIKTILPIQSQRHLL